MRKFYLHNASKTKSFDLNSISSLATEPSGLGNSFNTSYKESDKGKHLVNMTPDFEPIVLNIYFNADGSGGYTNYKALMLFLEACRVSDTKEILFEYNDGVTDKYCDVIFKSATKSEISDDNLFCEKFTFERLSYWYERIEESFALKNTPPDATRFPLGFPFGFCGQVFKTKQFVSNAFHISAPITITVSGNIQNAIRVFIATLNDEIVAEINLATNCVDGKIIVIDPNIKKITVEQNGIVTNGYGLTDKTKQSFLYLPQGDYYIGSDMTVEDSGEIAFAIKRYLLD